MKVSTGFLLVFIRYVGVNMGTGYTHRGKLFFLIKGAGGGSY